MKILLAGPIEGHLDVFYKKAAKLNPKWIVCAGDYGIWPDPARMDRASKKHGGTDFSRYYVGAGGPVTIPTLTIAGVHDDNRFLAHRQSVGDTEVLANVHWLAGGYRTSIGWDTSIRVTGLGRAYSEQTYNGQIGPKSHRHYTRRDTERGCSSGPTELLVVYEHLDTPGLRNLIFATRPKLVLNVSHPNQTTYDEIQNIPVIQLERGATRLVTWDGKRFIP